MVYALFVSTVKEVGHDRFNHVFKEGGGLTEISHLIVTRLLRPTIVKFPDPSPDFAQFYYYESRVCELDWCGT